MSGRIEPPGCICSDPGCRFSAENLHLFLEGEADPLTRRTIETHLATCPSCRAELRDLERERIAFLEAAIASPPLSPSFGSRVIREIRRIESERRNLRKLSAVRRISIFLAASAAVFAAGSIGLHLITAPTTQPDGRPVVSLDSGRKKAASEPRLEERDPVPPALEVAAGETPAPGVVRTQEEIRLEDWFDFSTEIFPGARRPCFVDLNRDGKADGSDAALLMMLAMQPLPSDLTLPLDEDIERLCFSPCQI